MPRTSGCRGSPFGTPKNAADWLPAKTFVSPDDDTVIALPLTSFPAAEWVSRYCFTKLSAVWERSLSHSSIPSSSVAKMTRLGLLGWVTAQAALIALMIAESGTRFRSFGLVGDCPCLAEMMIAVLLAMPCFLIEIGRASCRERV